MVNGVDHDLGSHGPFTRSVVRTLKGKAIGTSAHPSRYGWEVYEDDPKTDAGPLTIALHSDTVAVLEANRERQRAAREERRPAWGLTAVSNRFRELYEALDLPPVRLHDLRHGTASIAHAAGADLHASKEMLAHSAKFTLGSSHR